MSDAKAKAEARRAKILARGSSERVVSAVTAEEGDDALYAKLGEIKGTKDRPIAARRNLVKSTSNLELEGESNEGATSLPNSEPASPMPSAVSEPKNSTAEKKEEGKIDHTGTIMEEKSQSTPSKEAPAEKGIHASVEIEGNSKEETIDNEATKENTPKATPSRSPIQLPPAKTLEEIEREVAENTAKFDKTFNLRSTSKLNPERVKQLELLAKTKNSVSIDPSNWMRLLRLLVIGVLAVYTGYRTAETSRLEGLQLAKSSGALGSSPATAPRVVENDNDLFEESFHSIADRNPSTSAPADSRTWVQYFQHQFFSRSECTISAVMMSWWLAGIAKRLIPAPKAGNQKKPNIVEQLYNYVNGFQETAIGTVAEFAWHLFIMIFTVLVHAVYFANTSLVAQSPQGPIGSSSSQVDTSHLSPDIAAMIGTTCAAYSDDGTCIAHLTISPGEL